MSPAQFKQLRKEFGFSLNGMAQAMGMTKRSIQYYEAGQRPIEGAVLTLCNLMIEHKLLREAALELLDCPDLNHDSLEPETENALDEIYKILDV